MFRRIKAHIYDFLIPLLHKRWRKQCPFRDFTIISQDCMGGIIYNRLGMPFYSPTINFLFLGENFCKLAERPSYYFDFDAAPVSTENSPYPNSVTIKVSDIFIKCPHHNAPEDAASCWNRRRTRVNLNRMIIIANTWDLLGDPGFIERIAALSLPKIIFTADAKLKRNADFLWIGKNYHQNRVDESPHPLLKAGTLDNKMRLFERDFPIYKLIGDKLRQQDNR